jgi:hypothetical protein
MELSMSKTDTVSPLRQLDKLLYCLHALLKL